MWTWVSRYQNVSILDFIGAKAGGGNNCSCKTCKAPVKMSTPTNQRPVFCTGHMTLLSPDQQCQSTEGKCVKISWLCKHWRCCWSCRRFSKP